MGKTNLHLAFVSSGDGYNQHLSTGRMILFIGSGSQVDMLVVVFLLSHTSPGNFCNSFVVSDSNSIRVHSSNARTLFSRC